MKEYEQRLPLLPAGSHGWQQRQVAAATIFCRGGGRGAGGKLHALVADQTTPLYWCSLNQAACPAQFPARACSLQAHIAMQWRHLKRH
jgi:hypothetical protein